MSHKRSILSLLFDFSNSIFMLILILVTLYPLLHVMFASISNADQLVGHTGLILKTVGFQY